jgi:hypothetical protein
MKPCIVCARPTLDGISFELRADEEAVFIKAGIESPGPLTYCKSCWAILRDPVAAPQLMRGAAERVMLRSGVPPVRARAAADKLHTRLVDAQRRRHH